MENFHESMVKFTFFYPWLCLSKSYWAPACNFIKDFPFIYIQILYFLQQVENVFFKNTPSKYSLQIVTASIKLYQKQIWSSEVCAVMLYFDQKNYCNVVSISRPRIIHFCVIFLLTLLFTNAVAAKPDRPIPLFSY